MRYENYKSDLRIAVQLLLAGVPIEVPNHDFMLRFTVAGTFTTRKYDCKRIGDTWINCYEENGKVICCLDNHKFSPGVLNVEYYDYAPAEDFADGNYLKVVPRALDIELITGAGDDAEEIDASVAIDIEGALADVREATNNANEAAQSANDATIAANNAAENANSATGRADIAIDAMRATITQAETATGEAQAAANSATTAANNANTATTNANNASARANDAADNVVIKLSQADAAIADANTATSNANAAASNANDAADRAEEYIGSIDIDNYYTKGEINQKFADIISGKSWVVVAELPARGNSNYIYLVSNRGTGNNAYDEFVWLSFLNKYEKIGCTEIDLSNYYTKAQTDTMLGAKQDRLVSGENIKTINGESVLGAGNIKIKGSSVDSVLKVTLNTLNGRYSGGVTWDAMLNAYTSGKEVLLTYGDYTYRVYYAHYFGSSSPPYGVINASYTYGSDVYGVTLYKNVKGTVNVSSSTTSVVTSVKSINGTSMQGSGNITLPTVAEVEAKANTADLATVATSGSYNDLSNKPTIPAAQVNADWNAASGVAQILNKPTIPVVPTNVSAFNNDASYATTSEVAAAVATKQDLLVSGTNIKTINNTDITGSGNVTIGSIGDVAIVNDLTTGGATSVLSAEMGKVLAGSCGVEKDEFTHTLAYNAFPAKGDYPIMVAGKTYSIHIKADKPMGQTQWELWGRTASGTERIQRFGNTDMSVEQVITYTPAADIYAIGCNYNRGVQDTTAMITYIIEYDTYHSELGRHLEALDEVLQYGNALILDVSNIQKIGTSAPYWIYKQRTPIMFAGGTYKITVTAEAVLSSSQRWELWGADYDLTSSTRVKLFVIQGVDMSIGASLIVTPTQDIYSLYCGYQSAGLGSTITMAYKVKQDKESQRLHDIEDDVRACEDAISSAGINRFDSYFRLGATENDTINLITRPIGLIVMGQSNADGRIPNADFPATATIDTPNDLTLSKQIEHCLFMKGDQEGTYGEGSKTFASRNNSGYWAFDDIVYNAVNQALGGNTDFYVIKQTRGATGIRLANGSFNANVNDFVKNGYAISQLYHFKLLIERALELNPDIDFKAILWHQGEAEWQVTEEGLYYECLCQVIYWLRGRVGNPKLPFIFGTVPTDSKQYSAVVKADMEKVAQGINDCYLVDLGAAGDMIDPFHFGASTAERLAREMYKIMRQNYMLAPMINPL